MLFGLFGCSSTKYKVETDGSIYDGLKKEYNKGAKVKFHVMIPTDTNFTLYLDGKYLDMDDFENGEAIYSFIMPDHDVMITSTSENTMIYKSDVVFEYSYGAAGLADNYQKYHTYRLKERDDSSYLLSVEDCDGESTFDEYIVPSSILDELMHCVDTYDMKHWIDLECTDPLDGGYYYIQFLDGKEYVYVSSDFMPEDGRKAYNEIRSILTSYMNQ